LRCNVKDQGHWNENVKIVFFRAYSSTVDWSIYVKLRR